MNYVCRLVQNCERREYNMEVEKASEVSFNEALKLGDKTIASFYAGWCGKCRLLRPRLKLIAKQNGEDIQFLEVNIEESPELRNRLEIKYLPVTMSIEKGVEKRRSHSIEVDDLQKMVDELNGITID